MASNFPSDEAEIRAKREKKMQRARTRKAVERLGWKWVNAATVEIPSEREMRVGPRTIKVRGRVPIDLPPDLSLAEGERGVAAVLDPTLEKIRYAIERAATKILSERDDVADTHVFARPSMFSALEDARRGMVQTYQLLENRRVDERVKAELGLHFYLEGFTTEVRTFEYFVGPTNSGKTHAAIEALQHAENGIYLAPLRLLALEVYERLNDVGVPASLITGEERAIDPAGRHTSSTVEMVDLTQPFDVAVIDEAQMLEDSQRGWAWTLAIAGVRAKRVILCGSEEGLRASRRLAQRLGVSIAVRRFERKGPLRVVPAVDLSALRAGDAVVAFSRNAVIEMQGQVAQAGFSSAAIYGSLSPLVRRREAERFRTGTADILVATDAIGLGLNLPIRRLIFTTVEKYDGVSERLLTPQEIRQIAGRAGRYGLHEEGLVTAMDARDVPLLRESIEHRDADPAEGPIWISPTDDHLRRLSEIIGTTRVDRLLQFFHERVLRDTDDGLRIADLTDTIEVALALELTEGFLRLPFSVRCAYTRAPVTTRGKSLEALAGWAAQHANVGIVDGVELMMQGSGRDRLLAYEDRSRLATLYLWLAQRFPDVYTNQVEIARVRQRIDDDIHDALLQHGTRSRKGRGRRS
jgi:ATP-dependent RNA helicase SUPV3L1/SUV3